MQCESETHAQEAFPKISTLLREFKNESLSWQARGENEKGIIVSDLKAKEYKTFEGIKHISDDGAEFWQARELAGVLEYAQWRNFAKVLDRAMLACKNSGYEIKDHFAEASKTIIMPKTATRILGTQYIIVGQTRFKINQ